MTLVRFANVPIGAQFYSGIHGTLVFRKFDENWCDYGGGRYKVELDHLCQIIEERQ